MQRNGMTRETLLSATGDAEWSSIDDLVERLDAAAYWSDEFLASALDARKKAWVRREIKTLKDDQGWPLFASVTVRDTETGNERQVYKQEAIFDPDDYHQVVVYHQDRAQHHRAMAVGYAERAHVKFGMQLLFDALVEG